MGWLLVVLCVLPPVLLVISHVYGNYAQDQRLPIVVQLRTNVDVDEVTEVHSRRYHVDVLQAWETETQKGYRATVPLRQFAELRKDSHIVLALRID